RDLGPHLRRGGQGQDLLHLRRARSREHPQGGGAQRSAGGPDHQGDRARPVLLQLREDAMFRLNVSRTKQFTTLLALLLASLALAQEADDPLAGTTIEALGSHAPSAAPERALVFLRITMEPGTQIPAHHHPGAVV